MQTLILKNIDQLYDLKYISEEFDKIIIYTKNFKKNGVLRHVFKYSFWALKYDSDLQIFDEPHLGYGFKTSKISFWQVKNELFRCLKDKIEVININNNKGYISIKKNVSNSLPNGVSYCFLYNGNDLELKFLKSSFDNILLSSNYEILICGPTTHKFQSFFSNYNVKYIPFDLNDSQRVLYTKKKNLLFQESKYDIIVISHSRILITNNFIQNIFNKNFDVITPKIFYILNKKLYRYLDLILIPSYNLTYITRKKIIALDKINNNYLSLFKNKVPYIDGGLTVFNKNNVPITPYSTFISWGEGEDVEMCENLHQKGYLIDIDLDMYCYSQTNKLNFSSSILSRVLKKIKSFFHVFFG
jgi:hypothetical protein